MKLKKLKNLKFSFMSIVAFMAIMLITGCGDETTIGEKTGGAGNSPVEQAGYYDIVGTVVNDADDPIEHVFIDIIDFVMTAGGTEPFVASVRSDGNGEFGIRIPGEKAVRQVTLRFAYQDVVTYVQDVAVVRNDEVDLETITLTLMSQSTIRDSTIENTLMDNVRANSYVTIGPDALVFSDGTPFTTDIEVAEDEDPITATVAIGYVDTTSNPGLFPDNLYSMVNGSLKLFSTYGIIEVKVTTDGGNTKLNLGAGQTAAISIPVGDLVNVNDPHFPATVDMWYYDEDAAAWVLEKEDGFEYNAETRSFVGTVSHFSAYNAGYTFETKYVQASVMDDRGMMCPSEEYDDEDQCTVDEVPYLLPLPGTTLDIFTDKFSPYGVWNATYTAGSDGKIPDSMNPSIAGLLLNDAVDGYFVPVPGNGNLMAYLSYINPRNDKEGNVGPDLIEFDEGETKVSHDYNLALSTMAYVEGKVFYESGDPAEGAVFMFNNPVDNSFAGAIVDADGNFMEASFNYGTWSWSVKPGGEAFVPLNANTDTYCLVPSASSASKDIKEAHWNSVGGPAIDELFKIDGPKFADLNLDPATYQQWEDYGAIVLESPAINETLTIYIIMRDPAGEIHYTYLKGSIDLNDIPSGVDPDNLWVVIEGMVDGRPITVRGAVDADGNWPAGDGTFNPVTLDGEEGLFLLVPSLTELTITIGDYVTDPLEPTIYKVYPYTSEDYQKNISTDPNFAEYVPVSTEILLGTNTYFEGQVTYNAELGADLRVVFTKENPGEDDTPITVTTGLTGKFSATLEYDTDYIIEIFDDTDPLDPQRIYWDYYTSNSDSTVGYITDNTNDPVVPGLIQIGDEYVPPTGFPYDPNLTEGMTGVGGVLLNADGTPAAIGTTFFFDDGTAKTWAIVNDDKGTFFKGAVSGYTVNPTELPVSLAPETSYTAGTFNNDYTTKPYLAYTSAAEGVVEMLVIYIAPGAGEDPVPDDALVTGVLLNADGTPAAIGTTFFFDDGTAKTWAIVNDDKGTFFKGAVSGYTVNPTELPVSLAPETSYTAGTFNNDYTTKPYLAYTSAAEGVKETLVIYIAPGAGEDPVPDDALVTGFLMNADGTPAAIGTTFFFDDGTAKTWAIVNDDKGTFFKGAVSGYTVNPTELPVSLAPETSYTAGTFNNDYTTKPYIAYTSAAEGVVGTLIVVIPAP